MGGKKKKSSSRGGEGGDQTCSKNCNKMSVKYFSVTVIGNVFMLHTCKDREGERDRVR